MAVLDRVHENIVRFEEDFGWPASYVRFHPQIWQELLWEVGPLMGYTRTDGLEINTIFGVKIGPLLPMSLAVNYEIGDEWGERGTAAGIYGACQSG